MSSSKFNDLKDKFFAGLNNLFRMPAGNGMSEPGREKIIVFIISLILALFLWMMVNLSRSYTINVTMPVNLGNLPSEQALTEELPEEVTASVSGEGWKLVSLYSNPPRIFVDVTSDNVDLYDQVQQQLNSMPDIEVESVDPREITPVLERRIEQRVPVQSNVEIAPHRQYGIIGEPVLEPDSVTLTGAESLLEDIEVWPTDSVSFTDVREDIDTEVALVSSPSLVDISEQQVRLQAEVREFTEGEAQVFVQTDNLPGSQAVSFSPSFVTVTYRVPIDKYNEVRDLETIFAAYVDYSELQDDNTGFITPEIEQIADDDYHIEIRSFQPRRVAYFFMVNN